jgi:hypothetical protein
MLILIGGTAGLVRGLASFFGAGTPGRERLTDLDLVALSGAALGSAAVTVFVRVAPAA